PVVPGVLLLDAVVQAARVQFALGPATGFPRAKFLAPVLPAQEVVAEIAQGAPGRVAFTCRVGDRIVATGEAEFAP
ncbi:MAG TPA: hypothetical protein VD970_19020, partial [Acetobacteraceae bacterium]|nr:hypothetical protein [Acetobacteraceae bacterium]